MRYVVGLDQGTTGTTALVFDRSGRVVARGYSEFTQHYPRPGWVEHDPEEIWRVTLRVLRQACRRADIGGPRPRAPRLPNQRATTAPLGPPTRRPPPPARASPDRRTAPPPHPPPPRA